MAERLMLGVGMDAYEDLPKLKRAVADVTEISERLAELGFATETCCDVPHGEVAKRLDAALPDRRLAARGTALVVLWAGHAETNRSGRLRLYAVDNARTDGNASVVTVDDLAEAVARTDASQTLLVLDTCFAGAGTVDAAAVFDTLQKKTEDPGRRWVGIVAAATDYEQAVDGALAAKLLDLLRNGPQNPRLRLRWSAFQADLHGDDLLEALAQAWGDDEPSLKFHRHGTASAIMRNPLYRDVAAEQVVEHLLWSARGGAQSEQGFWFTGRTRALTETVTWIRGAEPGLCVVTGPPGCGKSAVVGRIVSLATPAERAEIARAQGLPPDDLDPREGSVKAHAQVRGITLEHLAKDLASQLAIETGRDQVHYQDVLAAMAATTPPPLIVIDGLDEAGDARFEIAKDFIDPLARYAQVVVASREVPGTETEPTLLESLGVPALRLDLDADAEATDRDVQAYVSARLRGRDGTPLDAAMDPDVVAAEVVRLARGPGDDHEGPFLLARVLTSQLIASPVDTSDAAWRERLSSTVEDAFHQDLARGAALTRDGEALPHAATELLSALAYSYGAGFPAEDVWPAVATAISPTRTKYSSLDAIWALGAYGRYITASSLSGQAIYRLHQRLADTLLDAGEPRAAAAGAVLDVYARHVGHGLGAAEHPYLWQYAWRHAVDGEAPAIERLAALSEHDEGLRFDVGLAFDALGSVYSAVGRRIDAVASAQRAVEFFDALAAENPASLDRLAGALIHLGNRYSEVGRRADAVAPTERGLSLFEVLAAHNPAFLDGLAGALNNLGTIYGNVGRHADAVAPTERALGIYEDLAAHNPAFLSSVALVLTSLGAVYSAVGRRADAVAPTERALSLYEAFAAHNRAYLGDLALVLTNLGGLYSQVGRRGDAIVPTERAVDIREALAAENPIFLSDLAVTLGSLGTSYSQIGRPGDAIAPTERALSLFDGLAAENPASLGDLAMTLKNLGAIYSEVGRPADAIAPSERALGLYEDLAAENPVFLPDLARVLNNLGGIYSEIGRRTDAIAPTERAVGLFEDLAAHNPAFLSDLAAALNNLGIRYSEFGRPAVAPTERALGLYEDLAAHNPAFLSDLAAALNNLGMRYSEDGRPADAIARTERAVRLFEDLAAENPAFLPSLAGALNNLGIRYSEGGRPADAIAPTERAVRLFEDLAAENPASLGDLAMALNNLGARYSAGGRRADAIAPTERAVGLYEDLAADNPAFLDRLAGALNNLGAHYSEVGRRCDAIAPTERAVGLFEDLAAENPVFLHDLAMTLNNLGRLHPQDGDESSRLWDATLARFDHDPNAGVRLRLHRRRPDSALDERIGDLTEAFDLDPRDDGWLTASIRQALRWLREPEPADFDRAWNGELPEWLALDSDVLEACDAWINTGSWADSKTTLTRHAEELLGPAGDVALSEISLVHENESIVGMHARLLAACRRDGIEDTFRPLLLGELIAQWRDIEDAEQSRAFLMGHGDDLLTTEAMERVEKTGDGVRHAILGIARDGEVDLAYSLLIDPENVPAALAEARRSGRSTRLFDVAQLSFAADPAAAVVHTAISLVLIDSVDGALEVLEQLPEEHPDAIADISDAIQHRPEHAVGLAALISALS